MVEEWIEEKLKKGREVWKEGGRDVVEGKEQSRGGRGKDTGVVGVGG